MRLIDVDKLRSEMENYSLQVEAYKRDSEIDRMRKLVQAVHDHAVVSIETMPLIDVETLSIVHELRAELKRASEERNAAIEQLRGDCKKCAHYRVTYNGCTPDFECPLSDRCLNGDMWEWKGVEQNERTEID